MPSVVAKFGSDTTAFKGGLAEMRNATQQWTGDIKGMIAGAFAAGTVISFLSQMRQEIARAVDLAQRFDTSAESIQRVGNAAKLAGSDIEAVAKQMSRLTIEAANSGDKFEALGINAEEFVNADMEGKLLLLAGAYEGAGDSQERMIMLMELLGNRGQDILPLLAQGVKELSKEFERLPVVTEGAAQAIARFDDSLEQSILVTKAWIGNLIEYFEAGITVLTSFAAVYDGIRSAKLIFTGDIAGMWEESKRVLKEGMELARGTWEDRNSEINKPGRKSTSSDWEQRMEAAQKANAGQSASEDPQAKLMALQKQHSFDRLTNEQKLADLDKQKAEGIKAYQAAAIKGDAQRFVIAENLLKLEEQTRKLKEDMAKAEAKAAEDIAKAEQEKQEAISKSAQALKDEQDRQALAAMNPSQQAAELRKRQAALYAESKRAAEGGDVARANELRLQGLRMNDDITRADKDAQAALTSPTVAASAGTTARTSIVASSLASIGGGGGVFISGADPQISELRQQTRLLQIIADQAQAQRTNPAQPYQL